jgi:hypothetical protein
MTGWNLPPGCNVSDIPGNRPEELEWEARLDKVLEAAQSALIPLLGQANAERAVEHLAEHAVFVQAVDRLYGEGYDQACADERLACDQVEDVQWEALMVRQQAMREMG